MKRKISTRITTILVLFVLAILLISSVISNSIIDKRFNNYLENQHEENMLKIKETIENFYYEDSGNFEVLMEQLNELSTIHQLYIEIENKKGKTIYTSGKKALESKNINKMPNRKWMGVQGMNMGEYIEQNYDIIINSEKIAELNIGYIGTYNLTEQDLIFKSAMNVSFLISGVIVLGVALIFSFLISKKISKPITSITNTANEMKNGNYTIRTEFSTKTKEFYDLSNSINYLADNLYKQEALRKRLTSDLVHEIKTPLTILNNHIEAFTDGIWEVDNEKLFSCQEEVLRLSKMVDNLNNIYMLEESKLNLNKEQFDITEFIKKIIGTFKPIYIKKNIELKYIGQDGILVFMDEDKIKQIIYNLLSNAYRYTDNNGEVIVSLEKQKENIVLRVKDNGIGISEEDLRNIFERFYRADASRDRETGGAGIGLTIVKTLIEAHKGSISVKSELNVGSEFIVKMPIRI
ncbi:sensor histidine kinase [Clostridium grantii]|uniref:histidine kinase n=1 Tax=Clostridium grantii DSM 8605 TaxID=1121316 RepID=A0A1M5UPD7_9CLOT|nr:ATP-binding protein [Clostridium grantii]SHH64810.1 Signal transduction histidine kinase [Clostridium grantii DSM 8605]